MSKHRLKQCPGCGEWFSWLSIITDPYIRPLGLNVDMEDHTQGYLHFYHAAPHCSTSFIIPTREIVPDIVALPRSLACGRADDCPGYCNDLSELAECHHECSFAPIRRLFIEMFGDEFATPVEESTIMSV